jgi:hypothetical protein
MPDLTTGLLLIAAGYACFAHAGLQGVHSARPPNYLPAPKRDRRLSVECWRGHKEGRRRWPTAPELGVNVRRGTRRGITLP